MPIHSDALCGCCCCGCGPQDSYLRLNRKHIKQLKKQEAKKQNGKLPWTVEDLERDPAISRVYAILCSKQQT